MILKGSAWRNGQTSLQMGSLTVSQIMVVIFAKGVCTKYYASGAERHVFWENVRLLSNESSIKHTTLHMLEIKLNDYNVLICSVFCT